MACPGGPCYVAVNRTGKFVFAASYGGGTAYVFPVRPDGSLGAARQTIEPGLCAHCIVTNPSNRFTFTPCLGPIASSNTSSMRRRESSAQRHTLVATAKGAGPRHIAFHPGAKYAYAINELDSTMGAYAFDGQTGRLTPIQTLTTLPRGLFRKERLRRLHVAPSGKFLYGSNRGHDSIVIYAIDEATGRLELVAHEPTGGKTPRNFGLDPGHVPLCGQPGLEHARVLSHRPRNRQAPAAGHARDGDRSLLHRHRRAPLTVGGATSP